MHFFTVQPIQGWLELLKTSVLVRPCWLPKSEWVWQFVPRCNNTSRAVVPALMTIDKRVRGRGTWCRFQSSIKCHMYGILKRNCELVFTRPVESKSLEVGKRLKVGTTPEQIFFTKMSRRGDFSKKSRFRSFSVSPPSAKSKNCYSDNFNARWLPHGSFEPLWAIVKWQH